MISSKRMSLFFLLFLALSTDSYSMLSTECIARIEESELNNVDPEISDIFAAIDLASKNYQLVQEKRDLFEYLEEILEQKIMVNKSIMDQQKTRRGEAYISVLRSNTLTRRYKLRLGKILSVAIFEKQRGFPSNRFLKQKEKAATMKTEFNQNRESGKSSEGDSQKSGFSIAKSDYYTNINDISQKLKDSVLTTIFKDKEEAYEEIRLLIKGYKRIQENNKRRNENAKKGGSKKKAEEKKLKTKFIILTGPHGCGKSTIGKAIAKELNIEYHRFDCGDIENKWQNSKSERMTNKTNRIIDRGKACVILFDEVDALMGRKMIDYEEIDESPINKTFATFSNKIEGKNTGFIVIFTTNHLKKIGKTIKNRSKTVKIPLPSPETRASVIEYYIKKVASEDQYDIGNYEYESLNYKAIKKKTHGYTMRHLRDLVEAVEQDCLKEILDEKSKKEKAVFTNERFAKFYDIIRQKDEKKEVPSLLERLDRVNEKTGFLKSVTSSFIGGFSGGLSSAIVSECHNSFFRIPRLQRKEQLKKELSGLSGAWLCLTDFNKYSKTYSEYNRYKHYK